MWGWFAPSCPLDLLEKTWTERRMRWFADQFGIDRLLKAEVILPTDQYFPDEYHETAADARHMMDRICKYMGVDPATVAFEVVADLAQAAGHYDASGPKPVVRVTEAQLHQPGLLAATLAHELAHELLLGGGLLTAESPDHERVTDLLPLYLGLGVFGANATIQESSRSTAAYSWWRISRQGYLPSRVLGYAFALFAFVRGETKPAWLTYLRPDAAEPCRDGLHYLRKTGDSLFQPDTIRQRSRELSVRELAERLRDRSPTFRLDALWDIRDRQLADPELVASVIALLNDPDEILLGEAASVVSRFGSAADAAVPLLVKALAARRDETRAGAATALGALRLQPKDVVPELAFLLRDDSHIVAAAATEAVRQFGRAAESATERVLGASRSSLMRYGCFSHGAEHTLLAISPDAERAVREHFADDTELCQQALSALQAARTP
jgi:HEAT repeat protein